MRLPSNVTACKTITYTHSQSSGTIIANEQGKGISNYLWATLNEHHYDLIVRRQWTTQTQSGMEAVYLQTEVIDTSRRAVCAVGEKTPAVGLLTQTRGKRESRTPLSLSR